MAAPRVAFALLCEGSSDEPLVEVLKRMLTWHGAGEALGLADHATGTVRAKLARLVGAQSRFDVVFVHRDADGRDAGPRIEEIRQAVAEVAPAMKHVPVVPVQMTEAWLLADEAAIRRVVGNPRGTVPLDLPPLRHIEATPQPKQVLRQALVVASEQSGRRRDQEKKAFNARRRNLLLRLEPDGPIRQLPSWQRLDEDIARLAESWHWTA